MYQLSGEVLLTTLSQRDNICICLYAMLKNNIWYYLQFSFLFVHVDDPVSKFIYENTDRDPNLVRNI